MKGQAKFIDYLEKYKPTKENNINIVVIATTTTGKCLPTFYLSNKKFAVTKYRVWSDLFFFRVKAGPSQGVPQGTVSLVKFSVLS